MSAFTYPTGYSDLLKDVNKRIGYYKDDRRKGFRYPWFNQNRSEIIKKQLIVKSQPDKNVKIKFMTGTNIVK